MRRVRWIYSGVVVPAILIGAIHAFAQRDGMPAGYPQSLGPALQALLSQVREGPPSPALLVQMSSTYFDIADDLLTDDAQRQEAYQAGARAAKEAFMLDDA